MAAAKQRKIARQGDSMQAIQIYSHIFFNWQTLLDIVLIATGLFFLYQTFLKLGTWKILIGMLAAFVVYIFATILNLEGIEWIFKNVSHVALLGLIIIFHPEIRKIFEKVFSVAFAEKNINSSSTIEIVADSLWLLASKKRGAIVVFPGKEQIQDKISGGFPLKALPSIPLILSIFDPNSPGHDGAVIITNNLLTHFSVRLPMSESSRLSEEFGTRHHAAMGMAEETDSLVLLVSEERGHISSFENGKMTRLNSQEEIITAVEKHFTRQGIISFAQIASLRPRTILQIASCLFIAAVFWSTLILGQKQIVERTMNIPIEYKSPGEGLVLMGAQVHELVVHAAGPKSAMNDFVLSEPKALVDLSLMMEGTQTIPVTGENIKYPKDITLLDISPSDLELTLAGLVRKTVPVTPQLIGQLPNGLEIKKLQVLPEELQVLAPPNRPGNKSLSISTTPIYLSSISKDSRILCKIIAPPSFQPVDQHWPDVEVFIKIE
jgi:diadenylate cyclase